MVCVAGVELRASVNPFADGLRKLVLARRVIMNRLVAVIASVLINAIALGVIAMGVNQSQTPHGKVYITELNDSPASGVYAQVSDSTSHGKLAL
jgi:hypothetical protein